jgi:DNA-binding HxlR family transcriptional regulator
MTTHSPTTNPSARPVANPNGNDNPLCYLDIAPELAAELDEIRKKARHFGSALKESVLIQSPEHADALTQAAVASTQRLFAKWNLEILYILAMSGTARFSDLKKRLGQISSRTLSNKLKDLESDGYVLRTVASERPLRVDYELTEEGFKVAGLTTPLVAHLNQKMAGSANRSSETTDEATPTAA